MFDYQKIDVSKWLDATSIIFSAIIYQFFLMTLEALADIKTDTLMTALGHAIT
jgi:hypothetical protein